MKLFILIGAIVAVLGFVALLVPSITFFTSERVGDVGFFTIDVSRPHTMVLNPIVGGIALVAGIVLLVLGFTSS